ncbi:MAG: spore maturation protein, partial [Candidatus Gastranaerophilales bacterium]|nr:spore maturation protein [Candidatus Gastranaerophilales bacterium]
VKKVSVYEEFIEGAKDGFKVSVSIIPYLSAIIVGISMFHASGAMDCLGSCLSPILERFAVPPEALPVMITRSLSGSATLGLFSDIVHRLGANSYAAKLCAVIAGSSETTFYVLAVYFGAVGINKYRYALVVGLIADAIGIFAAILVCRSVFLPSIG